MPKVTQRKRLTVAQKLELIKKLDKGYSHARAAAEFNIGKSTVSDIKKQKDTLLKYA